jgi:hypothetical protein
MQSVKSEIRNPRLNIPSVIFHEVSRLRSLLFRSATHHPDYFRSNTDAEFAVAGIQGARIRFNHAKRLGQSRRFFLAEGL